MKISTLIARLTQIQETHGDIRVTTVDWQSGGWLLEPVRRIRVEKEVVSGLPSLGGRDGLVILPVDRVLPEFQKTWDTHVGRSKIQKAVVL